MSVHVEEEEVVVDVAGEAPPKDWLPGLVQNWRRADSEKVAMECRSR